MVSSLKGGVLGLLSLPFCLLATIWNVTHLHLIVPYGFIARSFELMGWPQGRFVGLVLGGVYLFFCVPLEVDKKGASSATL